MKMKTKVLTKEKRLDLLANFIDCIMGILFEKKKFARIYFMAAALLLLATYEDFGGFASVATGGSFDVETICIGLFPLANSLYFAFCIGRLAYVMVFDCLPDSRYGPVYQVVQQAAWCFLALLPGWIHPNPLSYYSIQYFFSLYLSCLVLDVIARKIVNYCNLDTDIYKKVEVVYSNPTFVKEEEPDET